MFFTMNRIFRFLVSYPTGLIPLDSSKIGLSFTSSTNCTNIIN